MPEPRRARWRLGRGGPERPASAATGRTRRSGPPGEERWWRPQDQALAELELLDRATLGKGWRPVPMVNNVERERPLGEDVASAAVEAARAARGLTGLDEGRAWRHRDAGSLVVVRSEVYADEVAGAAERHRAAWQRHAEEALDSTWRERWRERDREPGWIEARWVRPGPASGPTGPELDEACDWIRIEDHTPGAGAGGPGRVGPVTVYEHLTVWSGRRQATVVIRHDVGLDLDDIVARCATEVTRRLSTESS